MKHFRIISAALLFIVLGISGLGAQSPLKGMSLNGATGLYSIPTAKIGWERADGSNIGLDLGYHAIISGWAVAHLPKVSVSLFKLVELHAVIDSRPGGTNFIGGAKLQLPLSKTSLGFGGNIQLLENTTVGQVYAAVTYSGVFFEMPAETTVVLGKTILEGKQNWDIDFGMGFDLLLFPKVFDGFVHWITDFANFSYSIDAFGADAGIRGVINTGLRIDLSRIPPLNKFKFSVDLMLTDAFDTNRAFSVGMVFGLPLK